MMLPLVRNVYARSRPSADSADRTLAVLVGTRALVERGWMQGGWYVLEAADGRRRFVGAGSLTRRSFGEIVQACLIGAVVESARWHTAERGAAGPAIDALWNELGEMTDTTPWWDARTPTPIVRSRQVRDLTGWNDRRGRTQGEVVALIDAAIATTRAATGAGVRPEPVEPRAPQPV